MDFLNNECPTDVLVDIKENKNFLSHINNDETKRASNTVESRSKMTCSNSEKCILSSGSCPTAILVDVPPPTGFCSCSNCESSSTQYFKEDELNGCKIPNIKNEVSNEKMDRNSNYVSSCKARGSNNSSDLSENQSKMSVKRLRWKTPSPQSMTRISKEASKVIDHLTSSLIFDEDLLLTEEILPITLNFDELDDDTDRGNSSDNVFEDVILNQESPVNVRFLNKIERNYKKLSYHSSNDKSDKVQDNLKQTVVERNLMKVNFRVSSKNGCTSKESYSSGVHSSPLTNSNSLTCCEEEDDDVFNVTHIASEDKENIQMKLNKLVLAKENKTATRNLSINKQKPDQRSTLKNLSNIKQETSYKHLSPSVNKSVTTPLKRMSISTNKKEIALEKPLIRKLASSVSSHYSLKNISQPNSFRFQNGKELISSIQMPHSTMKIDSACSSLSSDVKQQNLFATPSRRYSVCPPLKSASAIKVPLTPSINSLHNFAFPTYTPQPVKPSRLSFSRSLQQSGDNSQFFGAKGLKPQISTPGLSNTSKVASGIKNSSKPLKLSFSQSMSGVPLQSARKNIPTSSKGRFSSKLNLPSPLIPEQNKKLARALFTSVSEI